MELWRELLISGLQDENNKFDCFNDNGLKQIIENKCYKVLLQIIKTLDDQRLSDNDCFVKIEEIVYELEDNGIHCERHDFG